MKRKDVRVSTTDNWFPTRSDMTVQLSLFKLNAKPCTYRVCVWGEDDIGMEKDFETPNPAPAQKLFNILMACDNLTIEKCRSFGMTQF